jgi:uncharacterized protein (TIGR02596 family)
MKSTFPIPSRRIRQCGFSLLELLMVLTVMGILLALATLALGSLIKSSNLDRAASMVSDEFIFARQVALTRNSDVEVRFYQVGSVGNGADLQFRAMGTFLSNAGAPAQAIGLDKINYLPGQIIVSSNPAYSSLLDYTNANRSGLTSNIGTLPGGKSAVYVSFLFRPGGGTSLSPVTPPLGIWDVTLYNENASTNSATGLPYDFATIQIDPVTGNNRTHRP